MADFSNYLKKLKDDSTSVPVYIPGQGFVGAKVTVVQGDLVVIAPAAGHYNYAMSTDAVVIQVTK